MNKSQAYKIIKQISAAYPTFDPTPERLELWTKKLSGIEYETAAGRLDKYINNNRFAPTVADILSCPDKPKKASDDTASPAEIIYGARYYYGEDMN